jgi:two-component system chemotaxis response regulator CheY
MRDADLAVLGELPRGLSVLVVDDSPVMRNFIARVLGMSGLDIAEVLQAGDGREALGVLRCQPVSLVLSDINMPVMNGEEMLRQISCDDDLNQVPVIVVSTDSSHHRVETMLAHGARGYIQKPFQPEMLRAEIERVLEED